MENWYALCTVSGKEEENAKLFERKIPENLWSEWRILKKIKVFRSGGSLHLLEDVMFPGYLLIKTSCAEALSKELQKLRVMPQFTDRSQELLTPIEEKDLRFLKAICGEELQNTMDVTAITLDEAGHIVNADGVLKSYISQMKELNLHKRLAIVEVDLFNRRQSVAFSILLEKDIEKTAYEICTCCKKLTDIPKNLDISMRRYYVEGAGQLCQHCFHELYG